MSIRKNKGAWKYALATPVIIDCLQVQKAVFNPNTNRSLIIYKRDSWKKWRSFLAEGEVKDVSTAMNLAIKHMISK